MLIRPYTYFSKSRWPRLYLHLDCRVIFPNHINKTILTPGPLKFMNFNIWKHVEDCQTLQCSPWGQLNICNCVYHNVICHCILLKESNWALLSGQQNIPALNPWDKEQGLWGRKKLNCNYRLSKVGVQQTHSF